MFQCLAKPSKDKSHGTAETVVRWRGREDRVDHNFLLLTHLITCIEFRNYLPPPNPREVKMFKMAAPEAQSYLILIHILLAFGLLVSKVTENGVQTPKRVEAPR